MGFGEITALTASSNILKQIFYKKLKLKHTTGRPCCVKALHSRYLYAFIFAATFCPWLFKTGVRFSFCNALNVTGSSLKSNFVPTSIIGVSAQYALISGIHLLQTLSKETGETTLKQRIKTSVCG